MYTTQVKGSRLIWPSFVFFQRSHRDHLVDFLVLVGQHLELVSWVQLLWVEDALDYFYLDLFHPLDLLLSDQLHIVMSSGLRHLNRLTMDHLSLIFYRDAWSLSLLPVESYQILEVVISLSFCFFSTQLGHYSRFFFGFRSLWVIDALFPFLFVKKKLLLLLLPFIHHPQKLLFPIQINLMLLFLHLLLLLPQPLLSLQDLIRLGDILRRFVVIF